MEKRKMKFKFLLKSAILRRINSVPKPKHQNGYEYFRQFSYKPLSKGSDSIENSNVKLLKEIREGQQEKDDNQRTWSGKKCMGSQ